MITKTNWSNLKEVTDPVDLEYHLNLKVGELSRLISFIDHYESCQICQGAFAKLLHAKDLERAFEDSRDQTPEDEPHPVLTDWMIEEMRKDENDLRR